MNKDLQSIRSQFPLLADGALSYLDSASTTQKPQVVIDALLNFYRQTNANIHRGIYRLSQDATEAYEQSREAVRGFLNAKDGSEIVFLRGTTEAMNLVAQSFLRPRLGVGDEILLTELEHHSNIVPWQMVCEEKGARIRVIPVRENGELDLSQLEQLISSRTRLLAVTHVSNSLGTITPLQRIIAAAKARQVPVVVDGAQAVAHLPVDVAALDCDFYAFSGHKMYAPLGIGVLYGKRAHLQSMPPYQGGGDMILSVTFAKTEYQDAPQRFEAGTPHIAGPIALTAAIRFLQTIGWQELRAHEQELGEYLRERLGSIPALRIIGTAAERVGLASFVMEGVHPHDIGTVLDQENVAIRTGHHCTQPLMEKLNVPATARASLGVYNSKDDIDRLIQGLQRVRKLFPI